MIWNQNCCAWAVHGLFFDNLHCHKPPQAMDIEMVSSLKIVLPKL